MPIHGQKYTGSSNEPMNGKTGINDPKGCLFRFLLFAIILGALIGASYLKKEGVF